MKRRSNVCVPRFHPNCALPGGETRPSQCCNGHARQRFASAPVSYTHLDVYKRQTVKSEIQMRNFEASIPVGFFCYPISQAADITAFKATTCLLYTSRCV